MKYTIAHSGETFGGITGGWHLKQEEDYGHLSHHGGLFACSVHGEEDEGPWQIYAQVKDVELPSGCLGFWGLASNMSKADAWQYT